MTMFTGTTPDARPLIERLPVILTEHRKWWLGDGGSRADLSGADLRHADLRGAYLSGADLSRADLSGADLRHAIIRGGIALLGPLQRRATRADGYDFLLWTTDAGWLVQAGCRFFDMAEALAHWTSTRAGTPLGDETMDILAMLETHIARSNALK